MIFVWLLALASADCGSCHAGEAATLAASRHAHASELAIVRASAAHASDARWCAGCHRPAGAAAPGLVCMSCHAVPGEDDAIRGASAPSAEASAAHRVVVDAREPCARCHEFATPLPDHLAPVVYSSQPLQSTASELARTDPRARCADCHDPHRPLGAHDPATVRSALAITATSTADGVELTVTAGHSGHRVPTGDPFRRIVLEICDDAACAHVLASQRLGRGFADVGGVWAPVIDHTLADRETRVIRMPRGAWWRAELRYGDPRFEASLPADEVALVIAGGPLD